MKTGSVPVFWLLALVSLLFFACSNPAIMVLDPASNAYLEWQGQSRSALGAAADRAGYHLVVCDLNTAMPIADQIDAAWKRDGRPGAVLVYPPILSGEAISGLNRFPAKATILLGPKPAGLGAVDSRLFSLEIDRSHAFRNLGGKVAAWLRGSSVLRVQTLFLVDSAVRKQELDSLWEGFELADGPMDRFSVKTWDLLPLPVDLHTQAENLKLHPDTLVLIFLGLADADFAANLADWPGKLAGEQIGPLAGKMDSIVASIDVEWDRALEYLLDRCGSIGDGKPQPPALEADLHLYNEYLKK